MDHAIDQSSAVKDDADAGKRSALRNAFAPLSAPGSGQLKSLLVAVSKGDRSAFSTLYHITSPRLYALCLRTTGRADLAEEALQEGFVRIWRNAGEFDMSKGEALAWITVVVRNRARTLAEKARRLTATSAPDEDMDAIPDSGHVDGLAHVIALQNSEQVRACLGRLDEDKQRALQMVYFDGLTHQELARRLGVPLGTAKSWVRRGLAQMGQCLGGDASQEPHAMLAAEHELGALPLGLTPAFQRRRDMDAKFCVAADWWQDQFAAMLVLLPAQNPPARVWDRIEQDLSTKGGSPAKSRHKLVGLLGMVVLLSLLAIYLRPF